MRVMVLVKANEETEAGRDAERGAPDARWALQRGAGQGGRDAGRRGPAPELRRAPGSRFSGERAHGDRRPVRRDQGAVAGYWMWQVQVAGRGDRVGQARPRTRPASRARSRSARSSRPTTSARSSRPSCASRRSGCASRPRRRVGARRGVGMAASDVNRDDRGGLADRVGPADRRPGPDRARRRPRRGPGPGRARRGAGAVARVRRPGQPGRLADGHGQAPRRSTACAARDVHERKHEELGRELRDPRHGARAATSPPRSTTRSTTTCCG